MLNAIKTKLKKFLDLFSLSENLLRYIGGNEALPNPYTAEEEAELVAKKEALKASLKPAA